MALSEVGQAQLRLNAMAALELFIERRGGFATRDELVDFVLGGRRFGLIDRNRGIRNPQELDATLSVVSAADGPYADRIDPETGLLEYAFRAGDMTGGDNRKLRAALTARVPIIVFRKPSPNVYVPVFPAYVVGEDLIRGHVLIATDDALAQAYREGIRPIFEKSYVERVVAQRVHQPMFRAQVMSAYSTTCAICRLKHPELLDAAHIIADRDHNSVAHVSNGLALCKIHHAAYDQRFLGISPDYKVHVNARLLDEVDGPMLKHGIQDMHEVELTLPHREADWPSRDFLDERFAEFQA